MGGDDVPWCQPFAMKLLDEVLNIFEVMWGLTYQWFDDHEIVSLRQQHM